MPTAQSHVSGPTVRDAVGAITPGAKKGRETSRGTPRRQRRAQADAAANTSKKSTVDDSPQF